MMINLIIMTIMTIYYHYYYYYEAGAGPGVVEGGCQPVLALLVLIDSSLLSFSFSFIL